LLQIGNSLSMDIGSSCVKILYGRSLLGKVKIDKLGYIATPVGAFKNGYIEKLDKLFEVINEFISANKIKPGRASFVIHSTEIISRNLSVPAMKYKNLEKMIEWEMSQYINEPINEHYLSYEIVERSRDTYKVLAVIIPKVIVDGYIRLSGMLGLKLKYLDVSSKCLLRVFRGAGEGVAIIDLGNESIRMSIFDKDKLFLDTEFSNGFYRCVKNSDVSFHEQKLTVYDDILSNNCFVRLQQIIEFYNSNNLANNIGKIYLIGGGSEYKENIEKAKMFFYAFEGGKNLINQKYKIIKKEHKENMHIYLNCLGLLLRKG
jgi:Tfp pilus assembly PilM family ATPase